ncbi:putative mismatch repair protein [Leptomonas seymouri]|uniref:Putative mismatch repair protein n=1 Tax=Leptomonas seymouri TaxID=5684 RepID=A0A0N1I302_LEPSE|nr:putative mismatch repair protein [Leptomonas seymouri]|eukprot:KPI84258.1 putative mismatch repair protein [Leptomonas seymouri]
MATIRKLSADVVNRIAAGEVVQRPSAALKELLENAIDAGCTRIQVLAAEGGLEVLQVSDDGSGIHKEDLPLLCERYATSKLQGFEDLHHVTSFGFRGEALASISYVSRVTVTTRRRPATPPPSVSSVASASDPPSASTSLVAWRAQYLNGCLTSDPQPCAGNFGTTIRAEKLFYNALVRRNSLRASEEWGRIVDVVSRYALAYPQIGFTCQRDRNYGSGGGGGGGGSALGDGAIHFPPHSTTRHNIRLSHGSHTASHLRLVYAYEVGTMGTAADEHAELARHPQEEAAEGQQPTTPSSVRASSNAADEARIFAQMERHAHHVRSAVGPAGDSLFTLIGYTSDPTLAQRKPYLSLFINQRLVDSAAIRRALDGVYSGVLTGGNRPFTVLFLTVPTDRLDVNVHPTKKEVFLLDEELIVARISEVCRGAVLEAAAARQMDMLKMRHTTALALKQLPMADGSGGVGGGVNDVSGNSSQHILEKLRDQHRRGVPMASPLTSSSPAASSPEALRGGPAVVVAPCTMVRVEPQKGSLDRYFSQRLAAVAIAGGSGGVASKITATAAPVITATPGQRGCPEPSLPSKGSANATTVSTVSVDTDDDTDSTVLRADSGLQMDSAPAYEAPSWDAVIASLHRTTATLPSDVDEVDGSRAGVVRSEAPDAAAALLAQIDPESCCGVSSTAGASATSCAETIESMQSIFNVTSVPVKRERDADADKTGPGEDTSSSEDAVSDEDAEDDEEDRMREFRRHRRDVYERVEVLQKNLTTATAVKVEGDTTAVTIKKERTTSEAVVGEAGKPSDTTDASALSAVRTATEDLRAMERLGAVAQAADLLRDEALAAATHAPTFAHAVSYNEEDSVDEDTKSVSGMDAVSETCGAKVALVPVSEVGAPAVLSSVSIVVDRILANASPSAASLTAQLTYVGAVDAGAFLAQAGTTLVWCDTMSLVRHVVFQRIFLRWGQPSLPAPPVLEFNAPLPISELLATALAFDAMHLQPPSAALLSLIEECDRDPASRSDSASQGKPLRQTSLTGEVVQRMGGVSACTWRQLLFQGQGALSTTDGSSAVPLPRPATRQYIRRLVRRLCRWRGLLKEYFFIDITSNGLLVSVPYGLNRHWPPLLRALPLTVWLLAEAVPYPGLHPPISKGPLPQPVPQAPSRQESETTSARASASATPVPTQTLVEAEADGVAQEVACFTAVAKHLAETLYGLQAPPPPVTARASPRPSSVPSDVLDAEASFNSSADETWQGELVQHGLLPCLKNAQLFRLPDSCLRDGTMQSMVSVESLYKVFERC